MHVVLSSLFGLWWHNPILKLTSSFLRKSKASSMVSKPQMLRTVSSESSFLRTAGMATACPSGSGLSPALLSFHGRPSTLSCHSRYDGLRVSNFSFSVRAFTLSRPSASPSEDSSPNSLKSIRVTGRENLSRETCCVGAPWNCSPAQSATGPEIFYRNGNSDRPSRTEREGWIIY